MPMLQSEVDVWVGSKAPAVRRTETVGGGNLMQRGEQNQARTKAHQIRLTDDEWSSICLAASKSGKGPARYLVGCHSGARQGLSAEQIVGLIDAFHSVKIETTAIAKVLELCTHPEKERSLSRLIRIDYLLLGAIREAGLL